MIKSFIQRRPRISFQPLRTFSHVEKPRLQKLSRFAKYARRTGYICVGLGTAWAVDKTYNASSIIRNLRTLWTVRPVRSRLFNASALTSLSQCAAITWDYKWNFTPEKTELIPELHERVAERMYNLLTSNGGLYIKIGYVHFLPSYCDAELIQPQAGNRSKRSVAPETYAN